jgi:hypothetical protein
MRDFSNLERRQMVREAKKSYQSELAEIYFYAGHEGMCYHLDQSLKARGYNTIRYQEVLEVFPEMLKLETPKEKAPGKLWWPYNAYTERLEAFDKLLVLIPETD